MEYTPKLSDLLAELKDRYEVHGNLSQAVTGVTWDFAKVKAGFCYVCVEFEEFQEEHIQGTSLTHLPDALERGASVIVAEFGKVTDLPEGVTLVEVAELNRCLALITKAFYQNPFEGMRLVGITGTNGKTTTSQMLDSIMRAAGILDGVIGTVGVFSPSGRQDGTHLSNPMATEIFPIGSRMKKEGVEVLIMEVTSHAMVFERNHAMDFDVAIFTNLTQDHLDFHKTLKEYKNSKLKHFQALGKGRKNAWGIVNLDESDAMDFVEATDPKLRSTGKVQILTYGIRNPKADLVALPQEVTDAGTKMKVQFRGEELCQFFLPMAGAFNISNALAAFAAGFALGVSIEKIQKGLETCRQIDGRFERVNIPSNFNCFVDYAHTPDALDKILREVKQVTKGRLICVFGCGGDRDRTKRPIMGKIAAQLADVQIVTSDNPRSEDPNAIIQEIIAPIPEQGRLQLHVEPDRKKAIYLAMELAKERDSVVIAGKGHETYQQIGKKKHPFSDREVAQSYFKEGPQHFQRARLEVDLQTLRQNWELIFKDKPTALKILAVVKDDALGHGMITAARLAVDAGAWGLGVACLSEAVDLRMEGLDCPILLFGERQEEDLEQALRLNLRIQVQTLEMAEKLSQLARQRNNLARLHLKVDTGMGRYGVRWDQAVELYQAISQLPHVELEGLMTHLAMSDEANKDFANLQLDRFDTVIAGLAQKGLRPALIHASNTGGFLDLPRAHYDMVRTGILATGVYPSKVCRRLDVQGQKLNPAMSLKAKVAFVKTLQPGDKCGYGMHFTAEKPTEIAILPLGYGDGYPRMRNIGHVLIEGQECPIRGGISMDAILVEVTGLGVQKGAEVVLLGRQGEKEITAMMLQDWAKTVTYDIMSCWTKRLERVYLNP